MKKERTRKIPNVWQSCVILVCVIAAVVAAIKTGVGIQMGLAMGGCIAIVCALLLGNKWSDIQDNIKHVVGDSAPTLLILLSVGMMVGIWIVGGTVPTLLYYGLKICSPSIIVPLTFILCAITSRFTGSSFGSIATMGLALIPAILVLVTSALRMPAVPAMLGCTAISGVFACLLQKASLTTVLKAAMNGFTSETGVAMVDKILPRGGMSSMYSTVAIIILSSTMGAVLERSGVINSLVDQVLLKAVHKLRGLILSTMVYCYSLLLISGHQVMPIILGGRTFRPAYDKMGIQSRVLSRTLEDTCTIGAPLVPWGTSCAYMASVLGITMAYIPYAFLCYIVPLFSILYAFTGWFVWKKEPVNSDPAPAAQ